MRSSKEKAVSLDNERPKRNHRLEHDIIFNFGHVQVMCVKHNLKYDFVNQLIQIETCPFIRRKQKQLQKMTVEEITKSQDDGVFNLDLELRLPCKRIAQILHDNPDVLFPLEMYIPTFEEILFTDLPYARQLLLKQIRPVAKDFGRKVLKLLDCPEHVLAATTGDGGTPLDYLLAAEKEIADMRAEDRWP